MRPAPAGRGGAAPARLLLLAAWLARPGPAEVSPLPQPSQRHKQPSAAGPCAMEDFGYYNGSLAVTASGSECLSWSDFPEYVQQYPDRGLGNHNFCRNPDGGGAPWCFHLLSSGAIGWAPCDCSQGAVRLAEGGRVEVRLGGVWGAVCGDRWTDADASVVCRQLGLSDIGAAGREGRTGLAPAHVHLQSANCRGDEETLLQCPFREGPSACAEGAAAAACGPPEGVGSPLRLVGGEQSFEGRVEVYHDGRWGTVCDDRWDDRDAEVVCRQLGLSGAARAASWARFGPGAGPVLLDEVQCSGNELSLDQCEKSGWGEHDCDHAEDAGVTCGPSAEGAIRLAGGRSPNEGRVEVYHNGVWGGVCDDGWTGVNTQVACRQLGFRGPAELAPEGQFASGPGLILLDDVACTGMEASLLDCPHSDWGRHDCSHEEYVGLRCSAPESNAVAGEAAGVPVRLVDGKSAQEGRAEVFLNGQWGSICGDGWTDGDAAVVCRQLGYSGAAKARTAARWGKGHAPAHLAQVECRGTEGALRECAVQERRAHSCWRGKEAGVICDFVEEEIRAVGNPDAALGVCGLRLLHYRKKRIIGGNKSQRGGWPWQLSLRLRGFHREARLLCGATLIGSCWALTAAHCFKRFGVDVRRYLLRVGDHHTGARDEFERELPLEKIILHRNYQSSGNDNDIALIRMQGRDGDCLSFSRHVRPVCLPGRKEKAAVKRGACFISGWGDTGRSYSRVLLQGSVPLLPRQVCKSRYGRKFTSRMLCAGNLSEENRVDSCQGDSGGPLMCQRSSGHWVILGITSWGYGCGRKDSPGVYTKVSKFVPWIKKVARPIGEGPAQR